MSSALGTLLALVLSAPIAISEERGTPPPPAEQYKTLLGEYNRMSGDFRKAKTDLQRKAAVERFGEFPARFLDLADHNPGDPIALVALRQAVQAVNSRDSLAQIAWEMNESGFPGEITDHSAARAVNLLLRDHARSDKLGPVIDRMRYGYRMEFEKYLRTILQSNPHPEIQALACLTLAQFLNDRFRMVRLVEDRPELTKCYDTLFGKPYLEELQEQAETGLARRIEELFERAASYEDVNTIAGDTVAQRAGMELYDIRHLSIGKVAPDIVGKDQDGVQFRLSDYRGKVVLLHFWMEL